MSSRLGRAAGTLSFVILLVGTGTVGVAGAAPVTCGQVITQNTVLDSDVGPCPNNGIIVGADNITLNLNGKRVFGTPNVGDGAGILLRFRRGVTVRNGTVSDFDGGVVLETSNSNLVTGILSRDNIGRSLGHGGPATTLYGDGIALMASSYNSIVGNVTFNTGPYSGIGLYEVPDAEHPEHPGYTGGPTTYNSIQANTVLNAQACRVDGFCDNDGIRLEPSVGPGNVIAQNTVRNASLDGISLFGLTTGNRIIDNTSEGNGFTGAVEGDGIRVFGFGNAIQGNRVFNNAGGGISVGRRPIANPGSLPGLNGKNNQIYTNETRGNGIFDLHDSNIVPPCDSNVWRANTCETANQECVTF